MESNAISFRHLLAKQSWIAKRVSRALEALKLAANYEKETSARNQFAVNIDELMSFGIHHSDLRLLIRFQIVDHLLETTNGRATEREFSNGYQAFLENSCFRLTDSFLQTDAGDALKSNGSHPPTEPLEPINPPITPQRSTSVEEDMRPSWNETRQELSFGDRVVKRFRSPSPCQISILSVFEEDGWPERIDDPLPPRPEQDPKRRLHDTIRNLNRAHQVSIIRFSGDGTGAGVLWDQIG